LCRRTFGCRHRLPWQVGRKVPGESTGQFAAERCRLLSLVSVAGFLFSYACEYRRTDTEASLFCCFFPGLPMRDAHSAGCVRSHYEILVEMNISDNRNLVYDGSPKLCYGCRACEQICPSNCIVMKTDSEGFICPDINLEMCTKCGLCEKVCPVIVKNLETVKNSVAMQVYAAWNRNLNQRMESASGGIFSVLALHVLQKTGAVYGCALNSNNRSAKHIRIVEEHDLFILKGSKYVQSSTDDTFSLVQSDLDSGRIVLYSGTPCQIAGLKLFLHKSYARLITIDLVCHGTPSPAMLSAYIDFIENQEKAAITWFKFRTKKNLGWRPWVSWQCNAKNRYRLYGTEPYAFGFLRGYMNRESCYTCKFTCLQRVGDITLADYWGVESEHPELYWKHRHGISLVLCNTTRGSELLDEVKCKIHRVESSLDCAIAGNGNLVSCRPRPSIRDRIYVDLNSKGFNYISKKYLRPKISRLRRLMPTIIIVGLRVMKGIWVQKR